MESVLLEEADTDNSCNLNDKLLIVGKNIRTDELYDFHKACFLGKKRCDFISASYEVRTDILIVPRCKVVEVFAVAVVPVDCRIVTCISEGFVKCPEAAGETLCVLSNRLGEVRTLRRNRTDSRHAHRTRKVSTAGKPGILRRQAFLQDDR